MRLLPTVYLASYTLSALGNSIASIVLPLVVLQTTGSALAAGTVAAATVIPAVVAGLFMGVVIDRINRRTSSVLTDLISAASMLALPIVDMITGLSLGWFILFGIIGAVGDVPGITAREALLPAVIRHGHMSAERITGTREALGAVALLIGPAAAGFLVTMLGGTTALWITAFTSLAAALITLLIPRRVGELKAAAPTMKAPARRAWAQLREGWSEMTRNGFIRVTTIITIVGVVAIGGMQGIVLPLYFTEIDRPGMVGFVMSAIAAGSLVGGGIYATAGTRGTRRRWFVFGVLSIERIPEGKRGRVLGTQNTFVTAASPLGIFLAGTLTEFTDVHTAMITLAACWVLGLLIALSARSMRNLDKPAPAAHHDDEARHSA